MNADRTLDWDWYSGKIPDNVLIEETAYVETSFSFYLFRSELPDGVVYRRGASTYLGTMFDVGPSGRVELGEYALVHGARIICDAEVTIGDYALISWNVLFMDTYRLPREVTQRRRALQQVPAHPLRIGSADVPAKPIRLERNVWIGFEACVLPGVTIGEGAIVGAKSVVTQSVPPFTVVAGNPARVIRKLDPHPQSA